MEFYRVGSELKRDMRKIFERVDFRLFRAGPRGRGTVVTGGKSIPSVSFGDRILRQPPWNAGSWDARDPPPLRLSLIHAQGVAHERAGAPAWYSRLGHGISTCLAMEWIGKMELQDFYPIKLRRAEF